MSRNLIWATLALPLVAVSPPAPAQPAPQNEAWKNEDISKAGLRKSANLRARLDRKMMRDPNDVQLNFSSGLLYDSQSAAGTEGRQLAKVGYLAALRSDPTYWPANYQLGLLALEDGDALAAEGWLIAAALEAPDAPHIFYAAARAAYCAGNFARAGLALSHAITLAPPAVEEELVTAALVTAAQGDRAGAQGWLERLAGATGRPVDGYLQRRVTELLDPPPAPAGKPAAPAPSILRKMAIVDVVIIRRKEARSRGYGINLLDALTLQFGSSLVNSERSRTSDRLGGNVVSDTVNTISNVGLTVPTVTYSLNLANAGGSRSSIEARPTLLVYDGQPSKLFFGGTITYAASGDLTSQSFTKEVGLSLSVTPHFNDDDTVTLSIAAGLENFVDRPAAGTFREAVQTDKSSTEVTADLRFGETVILSSGASKNFQTGKSMVPVLGSIPLLGQLLFKESDTSLQENDLLIVLSVRREGVGKDRGSLEDVRSVNALGNRLWRRLGLPGQDQVPASAPEMHQPYYLLGNRGRALDPAYIKQIGLGDVLGD